MRGPSGLLAMDPEIRFVAAAAGGGKVYWPNGSEALVIGTAAPRDVERLRAAVRGTQPSASARARARAGTFG